MRFFIAFVTQLRAARVARVARMVAHDLDRAIEHAGRGTGVEL